MIRSAEWTTPVVAPCPLVFATVISKSWPARSPADGARVRSCKTNAGVGQAKRVVNGQVTLEKRPVGRLFGHQGGEVICKCHALTLASAAADATSRDPPFRAQSAPQGPSAGETVTDGAQFRDGA